MRRTITVALLTFIFAPAALHAQSSLFQNSGKVIKPPSVKGFNPGKFYVAPMRTEAPGRSDTQFIIPLRPSPFANFPKYSEPIPNVTRNLAKPQKISPMVIAPNPSRSFR